MAFALLFLGLLPMMFFSDIFPGGNDADDSDARDEADDAGGTDQGNWLDDLYGEDDDGTGPGGDPLKPITDDDTPHDGSDVDPGDVIAPDTGDDTPHDGSEIDPDDVLGPVDEPGEGFDPSQGSALQRLVASETDFDAGNEKIGLWVTNTEHTALGDGDETHAGEDDGEPGTGEGSLSDWDGTPILGSTKPIGVISGGLGADTITLGDGAAYAFGGEGDDTIAAGEGAGALFGGAGDDSLFGTDTGTAWIDGGAGADTLLGGAAGETLLGGAHAEGGDDASDDDTIDGGGGNDRILGGFGADRLSGGAGNDVINHLGRAEEEIHWERHEFGWHIDNDADVLDGGDGNDTLIMDRADSATGGAGADTFWVYFDGASGSGAADISDFRVGEDFLRVSLNPDLDTGDLAVAVQPSDDGLDGVVTVNGEAVAILRGAPEASPADVYAEISENIFA